MLDPYRMVVINTILLTLVSCGILFYRILYPKKEINLFVLLIIISTLPLVSLLRKGTYESGDLTLHSVFLRAFYESLKEGSFIPQWAANLCGGKGCPVFEFEYTLPFYLGALFHLLGFSFVNSIKLVLATAYIVSGIGMYLFVKEEFGKNEGFIAALFYLFAPFHLEEMHFRVGLGMVVSFMIVPFLFLSVKKLNDTLHPVFVATTSFLLLLLILAHSTTTILVLPLVGIYGLMIVQKNKKKLKRIVFLCISFLIGLLLSAFYWLPPLYEVGFTWYSKGFIINDFKPIQDYLFSPVMYGFLFQGHSGELRLIIGYAHLLVMILLGTLLYWERKRIKKRRLVEFFIISFVIYFFLLLKISKPVWENTPLLKTSILPWRALLPIAFITSFGAGIVVKNINNKAFYIFLCIIVILSTILNWGNRRMIPEDSNAYLNHWSLYTEYIEPRNYLFEENFKNKDGKYPILVKNKPKSNLEIIKGTGLFTELTRTSIKHEYALRADSEIVIKENTFYFPGWKVFANYTQIPIIYKDPQNLGLITFNLKKGLYKVDVVFTDTPIRKFSKTISLVTFAGILIGGMNLFFKRLLKYSKV